MRAAHFNSRLESVRGLAALMVAGGHALVVYPTSGLAATSTSALRTLFNGDAAVAMFFVLSGLVLGMGLQREGRGTIASFSSYCVRRVFRLYPLLLFSTVGILLFLAWVRLYRGSNFWFNGTISYRASVLNAYFFPTVSDLWGNILAYRVTMNLVTWTLCVEVVCSTLLPLAHYARVRLPSVGMWLLLAVAGVLALLGKWFLLLGWVKLEGAYNWEVLNFFYLFYIGYLLPLVGPRCFRSLQTSSTRTRIVFCIAICLSLSANHYTDTFRIGSGIGAWIVLGVLLYGCPISSLQLLDWPIVRFFGRVSYSFYLLHDLVLITCARLGAHYVFGGKLPQNRFAVNLALLAISITVASLVSWITYRWLELPFIQVGKQIATRLTTARHIFQPPISSANLPAAENIAA